MKLICAILLQLNLFSTGINQFIKDFRAQPGYEALNISVSIRSLSSGQQVYDHFSKMNLPPASTLKLVTTATAFEYLSGRYRFETMIYSNGRVVNGKVQGDILLEGIGDPTFGSPRFKDNPFEQVLQTLREYDIHTIEGSLKVLNNDAISFPLGWLAGDVGNYYGAFSAPFNFQENLYTVYFNGGSKVGDPAGIAAISPYDESWRIRNDVKTGEAGSGDQVNILNLPFSNDIRMVGTVPLNARNFAVKGAIPHVNKIFTDSLYTFLTRNGITIHKRLFPDNLQNEELGSVLSPEMSEIARETNYKSVNIFADGLANFMWESGNKSYDEFVKLFWKEKGLDLGGHRFLDGSGLSPLNTLSCRSLSSLLAIMKNNTEFIASIPVVGRDGTVSTLGKNTGGRISAKSGSITGTRNYAGYFTSLSGKKYAFSIYVNGFNDDQSRAVRAFLDEFFTKMLALKE
ncbi:MAG: D-alanyl-D-alanine carboxypeptidase/D-alanyl-D-alanine-endopeptidase [Leadbetterella sp.]|nr:D-alanyl-D-alanine carboxypeptidase/D-alanyl-D-alanine-endopeptidase [Leadbetterella sp.]